MKKLIFACVLLPLSVFAAKGDEILSDKDLKDRWVSIAKDTEVEKTLEQTSEFKKCIKDSKFDAKDTDDIRQKKGVAAEDCLKKELDTTKDKTKLAKLSDALGLESYGLVESKDKAAITDYLTNKLHKAMTGVDRKALSAEQAMKFENRKLIDQKIFIDLYTNHISKSVLFELSRYCFENFRLNKGKSDLTFMDHWKDLLNNPKSHGFTIASVNDLGDPDFGAEIDPDPKKAYDGMFKGITGPGGANVDNLGEFFAFCTSQMQPLCKLFKDPLTGASASTVSTTATKGTSGAASCLALSKLQAAKKGIADSKLIQKQFEDDFTGGNTVGAKGDFFQATGENSIDNLTNITSSDFLKGGANEKDSEEAKDCALHPEKKECDKFLAIGDSRAKVEHGVEISLRLKKEVEVARIRAIKDDDAKSIEKYLEDNGYTELLIKYKAGKLTSDQLEIEMGKIYDAKRVALLDSIKLKLGDRQLSEDEVKDTKGGRDALVQKNAKEVSKERGRMAQVVLFNNILTSHLETTDKGSGKKSTYKSGWAREENDLKVVGDVDENLFKDFKQSSKGDDAGGSGAIQDIQFLDSILSGVPDKQTPP
ncbi:MAG TPA: hypothetical protein VNJ08_00445 [Bacteriovoracaceae bacterium]|nr:hypothetical protein [Bacteriovoracaceae bacterium]